MPRSLWFHCPQAPSWIAIRVGGSSSLQISYEPLCWPGYRCWLTLVNSAWVCSMSLASPPAWPRCSFAAAYQAYLPSVVAAEDLIRANGRLTSSDATAQTVGPAIAGYLIHV